jgi:hypothetical protein
VWRGYDLPKYLRLHEDIAVSHGIISAQISQSSLAVQFANVLTKLVQAANVAFAFDLPAELPLSSALALSELFHQRMQSLSLHGKFVSGPAILNLQDWPWLEIDGDLTGIEEVGFRAIVAIARQVLQAPTVNCVINSEGTQLYATDAKCQLSDVLDDFWRPVLLWAGCDSFQITGSHSIAFSLRRFNDPA